MSKQSATNLVGVVVVVALVGGAAWFKSQRATETAPETNRTAPPVAAPIAARAAAPPAEPSPEAASPLQLAGSPPAIPGQRADAARDVPPTDSAQPADPSVAPKMAPSPTATADVAEPLAAAKQLEPAQAAEVPVKLPRLVDLGADTCVPCKKLAPILEELRREYVGRLSVEFIDVWKDPPAKEPYKIRLIPTQILYDAEGRELWRHEGFISKEDLKALFKEKVGVE